MKRLPNPSSQAITERLEQMDRKPFRDGLAAILAAQPSPEAIEDWAARMPLQWAQAISILAGLSGYRTEENRSRINISVHGGQAAIGVGSDGRIIDPSAFRAALIQQFGSENAAAMLAKLPGSTQSHQPATIDAVPVDIPPDTGSEYT